MSMLQKICDLKVADFAVQILNREQAIVIQKQLEEIEASLPSIEKLKIEDSEASSEAKKD